MEKKKSGPKFKQFCKYGHDLVIWRRFYHNRGTYCYLCNKEKSRKYEMTRYLRKRVFSFEAPPIESLAEGI